MIHWSCCYRTMTFADEVPASAEVVFEPVGNGTEWAVVAFVVATHRD